MTPVSSQALGATHADLARAIMNDKQTAGFELTKEANFAISPGDLGRFRVSAFVQMSAWAWCCVITPPSRNSKTSACRTC
jgi:twitching motility protein PilU